MGNFSTTDLAEDVKHALWSVVKRSRQLHWRNLHEPPLEGHNASNYEKTQAHIQRNWETIRQLRQDNKKLNERLSEVNTVSPCLPPSITFNYVFVKKKRRILSHYYCFPGRWAPHQRGLREQKSWDRGLPWHVGQGERVQLFICLSSWQLFPYFNK